MLHTMHSLKRLLFVIVVVVLIVPQFGLAQDELSDNLSCLEFLTPESVEVNIQADLPETLAGAEMSFSGTVFNTSEYQLDNSTIYARVFAYDGTVTETDHMVVDQFVVENGISLSPQEIKEVTYTWAVPASFPSGAYYVVHYVSLNDRYSVSGVPFSDNAISNLTTFKVTGQEGVRAPIEINAEDTAINGQSYDLSQIVELDFNQPQVITTSISNPTDEILFLPLQWKQYVYNALSDDNQINVDTQIVTIPANETVEVSYELVSQREGWGQVVASLQDAQAKHIMTVRYTQAGAQEGLVRFAGVTQISDAGYRIHACASGTNLSSDGTFSTTVFDASGNELFSSTQTAGNGFTGMLENFTASKNIEIGDIISTFSREGVVVHELTVSPEDRAESSFQDSESDTSGALDTETLSAAQMIMLTVGCIVLFLILFILFVLFRKKGETNVSTAKNDSGNNSNLVPMFFFAALLGSFLLTPVNTVSANTCEPFTVSAMGYHSQNILPSDIILQQGPDVIPVEDCQAMCNTAKASLSGDWYCNWLFFNEGMQYGVVVPGTGLSNGTTVRTCLLSQSPIVYENPFVFPFSSNWSATACPASIPANNAPNAPTISGPTGGTVNGSNSFSFSATDSNGDRVRYQIDWDNNGTGDAWAGGTGYVNSGVAKSSSYTWSTTGSKTFRARTQDENGAFSGWSSHTITISNPPASGTITGSGCTIASGNSSCTGSVSWSTTGASCRYVFNHGTGVLVSTNTSGTNQPTTLNFGTNRVALITNCLSAPINYFTAASIDDVYLTTTCASGTSWNGSVCAPPPPPPPSGTITGSGCTISVGSSVCNGQVSWNIQNASSPNVRNTTRGITISSNPTGSNVSAQLTNGNNTLSARDGSSVIASTNVTASCAVGSTWNGSSCAPNAPTTCSPNGSRFEWNGSSWVPNGSTATWNWDIAAVGGNPSVAPPNQNDDEIIPYGMDVDLLIRGSGFVGPSAPIGSAYICGGAILPPPPPPPSGSINGVGCTIPAGASTCNGTASWNLTGTSNPRIWNDETNTNYHVGLASGTNEPVPLTEGVNRVVAYDDTTLIDFVDLTASCAVGSTWNGSSCAAPSCVANWDCYDETIIEGPYTGDVYTSCQAAGSPPPANGGCVVIGSYMTTNSYDGTYSAIPPGASQCGSVPACTATPVASVDLKINGSDAPIIVSAGDDLRITWTSANVSSCVGSGNGWSTTALSGDTGSPSSVQASGLGVQTYTLSCNGYIDQVQVTVTAPANSAPNAPTITGPTSVETGAVNTFGISATDPDGDQLYYQIDWNNDGTPDVNSPNTGYWASGTNLNANRTWASVGSYTFRARAVDSNNLQSAWSTHTVTVALPPVPPPNPTIEASVGGSAFTTSPGPLTPGQSLAIRWNDGSSGTAPGATCTGTNFNTGSNPTGTDTNSGSGGVTDPTPGSSLTYTVSCTNDSGSTVNRSVTVTSLDLPDLTIAIQPETLSSTFDPTTGNYDSVSIPIFVENVSGTDVLNTFTVTIELDYDGGGVPEAVRTYNIAGLTGSGPGAANTQVVTFNNVPFGLNTVVTAVVDSANDVAESNEGNNEDTRNVAQVPPDIDMDLTIDPADLVRGGEDAVLEWDTNAAFPMTCTLSGPALATITFDPSVDGPTGTATAGPITAKSVYTLTCTEPITSTTYTASVSVETTGSVEEI